MFECDNSDHNNQSNDENLFTDEEIDEEIEEEFLVKDIVCMCGAGNRAHIH